jgi:hypothetical protein
MLLALGINLLELSACAMPTPIATGLRILSPDRCDKDYCNVGKVPR